MCRNFHMGVILYLVGFVHREFKITFIIVHSPRDFSRRKYRNAISLVKLTDFHYYYASNTHTRIYIFIVYTHINI